MAAARISPLASALAALKPHQGVFAGYKMPLWFSNTQKEHAACRTSAVFFDVSHMGQVTIRGADRVKLVELATTADVSSAAPGAMKLAVLCNEQGGVLDDLIVAPEADQIFAVVNAGNKDADVAHLKQLAKRFGDAHVEMHDTHALVAVQGPAAAAAVQTMFPDMALASHLFMHTAARCRGRLDGGVAADCRVSRCGYTGEDGFEIAVPIAACGAFVSTLTRLGVTPAGLAARDTLRCEAGLCLYGHELDTSTSPIAAGLAFLLSKRRRAAGGFIGAERVLRDLAGGTLALKETRVGIALPKGVRAAREGAKVMDETGAVVGRVTSGVPSPTLGHPIAMAYVPPALAAPGTAVKVGDAAQPAVVCKLPFVPTRYYRGPPKATA